MAPGPFTVVPAPVKGPRYGEGADEWAVSYHGYLQEAFAASLGKRSNPGPGQTATPWHAINMPLLPDDIWNTWLLTNAQPGPWAHMTLSLGSSNVYSTVFVGAWSHSNSQQTALDAKYAEGTVSFGPSLGFKYPDIFGTKTRFELNVGSTGGRYGNAGKWDAGPYGTPAVGAVGYLGYLNAFERDFGDVTLRFENGFGLNGYPGDAIAGTTAAGHAHLMFQYKDIARGGLHHIATWTNDERVEGIDPLHPGGTDPDGSITSTGADVRVEGGIYGNLFLGASYVKLKHAKHVGGIIQVVNVAGGKAMMDNFLGNHDERTDFGTGSLQNLMFQYEYSFGTLARYPEAFWGDGPDLKVTLFGIYTHVASIDPEWDNNNKLKVGGMVVYAPIPWLAGQLRFDRVMPSMADPSQSFAAISPRLLLRSTFVSHETVGIQYSHYFYAKHDNGTPGLDHLLPAPDIIPRNADLNHRYDDDVVSIVGSMWF
jgi:hypothetical protein